MKYALLAILTLCPAFASASALAPTTFQTTCSSVTIGLTPTEMTGNLAELAVGAPRVSSVKVTNLSATADVCCSHAGSVTCSGDATGDYIAGTATHPKNWLSWTISAGQGWFCVSTLAGAPVISCLVKVR